MYRTMRLPVRSHATVMARLRQWGVNRQESVIPGYFLSPLLLEEELKQHTCLRRLASH